MCAGYTSSSKLIAFDDYAYSTDGEETFELKHESASRVGKRSFEDIAARTKARCTGLLQHQLHKPHTMM